MTVIEGQGNSLKTAVEELCWKAGIELRSYDAPDRPFSMKGSRIPLNNVLRRLLRRESFLLGYRTNARTGGQYVAWLRVLGDHFRARTRRQEGGRDAADRGFNIPPEVLRTAFAGKTDQEREKAIEMLSRYVTSNSTQRHAFLSTDASLIAETLERFPNASSILERMKQDQRDSDVSNKLEAVIAALQGRN